MRPPFLERPRDRVSSSVGIDHEFAQQTFGFAGAQHSRCRFAKKNIGLAEIEQNARATDNRVQQGGFIVRVAQRPARFVEDGNFEEGPPQTGFGRASLRSDGFGIRSIDPVSYTHLDVYKRQIWCMYRQYK